MSAPLIRESRGEHRISVSVKRFSHAATKTPSAQLWLIAGGPGATGATLAGDATALLNQLPGVHIYVPDHRGTGRSSHLGCPRQEAIDSDGGTAITQAEWNACIADLTQTWGEELAGFSTREATLDLAQLIQATRTHDVPVVVYGRSYGTYLVQLLLRELPDVLDGVVLDAPVPLEASFVRTDVHRDQVGMQLLDYCARAPQCAKRFDAHPRTVLKRLLDQIDHGHCSALGTREQIRRTLRMMMGVILDGQPERVLIPAIVSRALRCTEADQKALVYLFNQLNGATTKARSTAHTNDTPRKPTSSAVLFNHISLSELWEHPGPSVTESETTTAGLAFSKDVEASLARLATIWPVYRDPDNSTYPQSSTPVLVLTGTLDASTPTAWAQSLAEHYREPHQRLVTFPRAPHGVLRTTPILNAPDKHCGLEIVTQFVREPSRVLDRSCLHRLAPLDFDGPPGLAQWAFSTETVWN